MADLEASADEEVCDLVAPTDILGRPRARGLARTCRLASSSAALRRAAARVSTCGRGHHAPADPQAGRREGVTPGAHSSGFRWTSGRARGESLRPGFRKKRFFEWKNSPGLRRRSCGSSARRAGFCRTKSGISSGLQLPQGRPSSRRGPRTTSWKFLRRYVGRALPSRRSGSSTLIDSSPPSRPCESGRMTRGRVARAKGIFHTTRAGASTRSRAAGSRRKRRPWRRDSRVDVILKDPETGEERGDFFE